MARTSAGLVPFRVVAGRLHVYLVHMAGPYWAKKDAGAWSIAKGEYAPGEDPRAAARREFAEEVGRPAPEGDDLDLDLDLGEVRLPGGKRVRAFAMETNEDLEFVESNLFTMEWPPRSGRMAEFPEVDAGAWFDLEQARVKLVASQVPILDTLEQALERE